MASIIHESDGREVRLMASGVAGGDITSLGGLLWVHDLCEALGAGERLREHLAAHPGRTYDDFAVAHLEVLSLCVGEKRDSCAEHLRLDAAFEPATGGVPSQETVPGRLPEMGAADALRAAVSEVMDAAASLREARGEAVVDLDSTLPGTFGRQDEAKHDTHYDAGGIARAARLQDHGHSDGRDRDGRAQERARRRGLRLPSGHPRGERLDLAARRCGRGEVQPRA